MTYEPDDEQWMQDDELDERPHPTLSETIEALKEGEATGLTSTIFDGLSDLEISDLEALRPAWQNLDAEYRERVLRELSDTSETNYDLDYSTLAFLGLEDLEGEVRAASVDLLWSDETLAGMRTLLDLVFEDDAAVVRAEAASGLGKYILLGELGSLPQIQTSAAVDACFSVYQDEDEEVEVRRRALESLGNSSRDGVEDAIREAYNSDERLFKIGALFAMGKTYDELWSPIVMHEMNSPDAELRYEAARAAGEIAIEEAIPKLSRLVYEPDRDIKEVSIWALGEIGGKEATRVLQALLDDNSYAIDEGLIEAIEDALVSASMPGEDLAMLDYDGYEEADDDWDADDPQSRTSRWN